MSELAVLFNWTDESRYSFNYGTSHTCEHTTQTESSLGFELHTPQSTMGELQWVELEEVLWALKNTLFQFILQRKLGVV